MTKLRPTESRCSASPDECPVVTECIRSPYAHMASYVPGSPAALVANWSSAGSAFKRCPMYLDVEIVKDQITRGFRKP